MKFQDKFQKIVKKNNSLLCVGLDPDPDNIPDKNYSAFNKKIIDQVAEFACAFKPNIAFYEAEGLIGLNHLLETVNYLEEKYPEIPIILDAKRADIPNTARFYAKSAFEFFKADALTVYPHLGKDSVDPFLGYKDKLTILLFKTSNNDSGQFQNLNVSGKPYYLKLAEEIAKWKENNIGIFVGATYPKDLATLRKVFPNKIFLSAGIGAQSAEVKSAVKAGTDKNGEGIMFNASRSIIYNQDPKAAAKKLRDEINKYRN